jgi:uncharacterized protein (DUF433 family)
MTRGVAVYEGSYEAPRAAALSGVPVSTVYDWARKEIVVPSLSAEREKLWSYADLMALRIVYWLRHPKGDDDAAVPASPMHEVRRALGRLDDLRIDIWANDSTRPSPLLVDRTARIYIAAADDLLDAHGQHVMADCLDLLAPFVDGGELRGPDLRQPRPRLRIVPGKCAGEPHLQGTRLTTQTVAALVERGYDIDAVHRLYPDQDLEAISEAVDLERQLGSYAPAA